MGEEGRGGYARIQGEFLSHGIKMRYFVEENVACETVRRRFVSSQKGYVPAVVTFL